MNNYNLSFRFIGASLASLLIIMSLVFGTQPDSESYAKSSNDLLKSYGLIVHNTNATQPVPRLKVLQVLFQYFPDVQPKLFANTEVNFANVNSELTEYNDIKKACDLKLIDCSSGLFLGNLGIYQKDLLIWFYKLKYNKNPNYLAEKYPKLEDEHMRAWLEARSLNLLSGTAITYQTFSDLLYRNKVSENNLNQAYKKGLVADSTEINADNYHNLKGIQEVKNNFINIIQTLSDKDNLNSAEKAYYEKMTKNIEAVYTLEQSLAETPYILRQNPNINTKVTEAVKQYGLQEVLYSYSYDYSKNATYRKHNVTTAVNKMNGKVYMPGDIISYWDVVSDNDLSEFKYGWVILGNKESWRFGGGLCGASSTIFIPSWKAGLEVVERKNHSKYYTNLYPTKDIGLDATVYRPSPNLKLRNNTGSPIVYRVNDDKEKQTITVSIIGNKSYKNMKIEGPIYVSKKHIKWIRQTQDFDGNISSNSLESRYDSIL